MGLSCSFLGIGSMGGPMAANLLKNGVKLFVYNRTNDKTQKLVEQGAIRLDSPQEAFGKAPVAISMVANDAALQEVSEKLLQNAPPRSLHISMSTVSPQLTASLVEAHRTKGVEFVAAPVFGRPDVAEKQALWIVMAGQEEAKTRAKPYLSYLGKKVYDFGTNVSVANSVKITGNFLILSMVELFSEAFTFAQKSGADLETLLSFFTDSLFPSPVITTYGNLIIKRKFSPAGFKMALGFKDIELFLQSASQLKVPSPIANLLHDRLLSSMALNRGEMDWSAIALSIFEQAGLQSS